MTANEDGTRVRRAAASVGLWVGVTTAIITIAGVLILIWAIRIGSRREQGEHQGPGGERGAVRFLLLFGAGAGFRRAKVPIKPVREPAEIPNH